MPDIFLLLGFSHLALPAFYELSTIFIPVLQVGLKRGLSD